MVCKGMLVTYLELPRHVVLILRIAQVTRNPNPAYLLYIGDEVLPNYIWIIISCYEDL